MSHYDLDKVGKPKTDINLHLPGKEPHMYNKIITKEEELAFWQDMITKSPEGSALRAEAERSIALLQSDLNANTK